MRTGRYPAVDLPNLPDVPFVAWDWDETLCQDWVNFDRSMLPLLNTVRDMGLRQVVVSGRYPEMEPISFDLMPVYTVHITDPGRTVNGDFNAKRFKLWLLRTQPFREHMVVYVDADIQTLRVLGSAGVPVCHPVNLTDYLFQTYQSGIIDSPNNP